LEIYEKSEAQISLPVASRLQCSKLRIHGMSPVKNNPLPDVIGSALKAAREARRLERVELANLCCLSAKMILELEEGGMTSFYSFPLKVNAAKRVGKFLNLSESDYLSVPQVSIASNGTIEEASLEGAVDDGELTATSLEPNPSPANESLPASSADSSITERLEWQELLTEKVGVDVSGPESKRALKLPLKPALYISIGLVIAGLFYGVNQRYDITYQLSSLMERKIAPQETPPAESSKEGLEEVKAEAQNEPAAIPETKSAEVVVASGQCPFKQDAQILSYQSPNPSKVGDVVNIKTLIKQTICFVDGGGKQSVISMEANTANAFKGSAPFTVLGQDLDNVEMYFQGWRVRLPSSGSKQVKLIEVNL
jgi:transcriptional regulator with XRE-family HTH domain